MKKNHQGFNKKTSPSHEIPLIAIIYWTSYLEDEEVEKFQPQIRTIIDAFLLMVSYDSNKDIPNMVIFDEKFWSREANKTETGLFILHSLSQLRCIITALNQLNRILNQPFGDWECSRWRGKFLSRLIAHHKKCGSFKDLQVC